ncbi:cytochrome P450 family protein [Actinomadura fibrosa]|uniref:Cytochrome P450 n=1 Tax=Actinomadura fibrosa TaxID=111802 RepID=A0ABW2Y0B1_9ACTN|nr:cytochrome P450 [Actinomadura fibrosa]
MPRRPRAPFMIPPNELPEELGTPGPPRRVSVAGKAVWILSRYADVRACLADGSFSHATTWAVENGFPPPAGGLFTNTVLGTEPPEHTRLRRLIMGAFTTRRVQALRPRVQQITDALLDSFAADGHADLVRQLAFPLPMAVICELLGVPADDRADFRHWADTMFRPGQVSADAAEAADRLWQYIHGLVSAKRDSPGDDLLTGLLAAHEDEDRLTYDEVVANGRLLLHAGYDTTANFIGNAALTLLRDPARAAALRTDPALLRTAVDELLRHDGPSLVNMRFANQDTTVAGTPIRRGDQIVLDLEAAHSDPSVFPDGGDLDFARSPNPHLTFGHGLHHCIGAPLARLEGQIALSTLFTRFPDIRLAVPAEQITRRPHSALHGVTGLPVVFTASGP